MKLYKIFIIFFLIFLFFNYNKSLKILIKPAEISSHGNYFFILAKKISKLGHQVHYIVSSQIRSFGKSNNNLTILKFEIPEKREISVEIEDFLEDISSNNWFFSKIFKRMKNEFDFNSEVEKDCISFLKNKDLISKIKKINFDFLILDLLAPHCYVSLHFLLQKPFAIFSIPWITWIYRVPRLDSFTPSIGEIHTDQLTFSQRLTTVLSNLGYYFLYKSFSIEDRYFHGNHSIVTDGIEAFQRASLWIFLEDLSVGFPNCLMPNTLSVGDIMVEREEEEEEVEKLDEDLRNFIDKFPNGFVYFTFGSYFKNLPFKYSEIFCKTFKFDFPKIGFIWKSDFPLEKLCPEAKNILIKNWFNQNKILKEKNLKVFISHGGVNSIIESIAQSKPLLIFPIAFDQPNNAAMAGKKGYAKVMNLKTFNQKELKENLHQLLNNKTFKKKAEFFSKILKNKNTKPEVRVAQMIDHVVQNGDSHLKSGAFELNFLQFFLVDVILFLFFFILMNFFVFILIFRFCFKLFFKYLKKKQMKNEKNKKV